MFRPLLGHLQALRENRSKNYLYSNALWDPKFLHIVLYECEIQQTKNETTNVVINIIVASS